MDTTVEREDQNCDQNEYRILCIDGGGILGTFPAAFLAELEQHFENNQSIGSYFDLIAGTSTGGIIAIALALGHPASEILSLYEENGPKIFGEARYNWSNFLSKKWKGVRRLYRSKYDSIALQNALQGVLGDQRIGHARTRLVVPAWDAVAQSVYIFKTAHHSRFRTDYRSLAIDASMATAAAPTYFPQHLTKQNVALLDGGVWANNPVAVAVVEAIGTLGWKRTSLRILSLGCLAETYAIPKWAGTGTLWKKAYKLFLDGQSQGAIGMAKMLTGHKQGQNTLYRINHTVPYNSFKIDDSGMIGSLKSLGHSVGRNQLPILRPVFFDHPAKKFNPVYKLNEDCYDN